jgi:undecaprenyl diphosphate synthase
MEYSIANNKSNITHSNSSSQLPIHIAIIMDGNGRWAGEHGKSRIEGHKKGAMSVIKVVKACIKEDIKYLTLYAFSSDNWNRPPVEVDALMSLLKLYILKEASNLNKNGVRVYFIGEREPLAKDLQKVMANAESNTKDNTKLNLIVAINYGGREEIIRATKSLISKVISGDMKIEDITADKISGELYTKGIPDPDIIVRTSGEQRISNFLLWQCAYSEFVFIEKNWPDFEIKTLGEIIDVFKTRNRRYGGLK